MIKTFPGIAVLIATCSFAGAEESASAHALAALDRFMAAWNRADVGSVRAELNFPHLTISRSLTVVESPDEFSVDFDAMRKNEGWARSAFGPMTVVRESANQVHLTTTYSRYNESGTPYQTGNVLYVVTNVNGHWGMQLRCPFGAPESDPDAVESVTDTVNRFFTAWNAADNAAIHQTVHFPHAFLFSDGRVAAAAGPAELMTDFAGMRQREGWDRSTHDALKILHADDSLALVYLTFHRLNAEGTTYRSVPALWIFTRDDSGFGLQVRAILEDL